jgi:hypothetical protein
MRDAETDDGLGPYAYCYEGRSHCLNQTCPCVNSRAYRAAYRRARGQARRRDAAWLILGGLWLAACACGGLAVAGWQLGGSW